jgi:glycolate oxidase iron-sulfur subunit
VHYGQLIDASRALYAPQRRPATRSGRLGLWLRDRLIVDRTRLGRAARLLRLYRYSGLRWLARSSGLLRLLGLKRLDSLMPAIPAPPRWQAWYPPTAPERGRVALFTGCIGNILDREALEAAIRVLNACGYGVHVPPAQTCCGALHLHDGEPDRAAALARTNLAAFDALEDIDAVLFSASGCGATLAEYATLPVDDPPTGFRAPVQDLCAFLEQDDRLDALSFAALDRRVVIHDPCTLTNVLRTARAPYRLLARIPDLQIEALAGNTRCCGAAGSYLLTQPAMADSLRADKLEALQATGADILLTSNTGCAMYLATGMRERGRRIEVLHPVTLLARQLRASTRSSS